MIKPCRSTCETLRKDCIHAFEAIEMAWPYFLDCDRFFASEQEGCFDPLAGLKGKCVTYVVLYCANQVMYKKTKNKTIFLSLFPDVQSSARQELTLSSLSPEEPSTIIQFTYTSNTQMYSLLKRTAAKCSHISHVYSIGRSTEGRDLLVIEFTDNPGQHELCK